MKLEDSLQRLFDKEPDGNNNYRLLTKNKRW